MKLLSKMNDQELKELLKSINAKLDNQPSANIKQVMNGLIISIIMMIIAGGIAFVKIPYSNAQALQNHIKDDRIKWNQVDNEFKKINENFKSIKPHLPENTHIIEIQEID